MKSDSSLGRPRRRPARPAPLAVWLALACAAACAPPAAASAAPSVEPRAGAVLAEMVRAYRALKSLDQETTIDTGGATAGALRAHLQMQRPNRLLLQQWRRGGGTGKSTEFRLICDGKCVWKWSEDPGSYTQTKAPRDLSGLKSEAGGFSLELAMLTGLDPFGLLAGQARSVRLTEPEEVDGVPVEVVVFELVGESRTGEARAYVGRADHLLHRLAMEMRLVPQPVKHEDGTTTTPEPPPPTRFSYTNTVRPDADVPKGAFTWAAPPGAFRHTPYPSVLGGGTPSPGDLVPDAGLPAGGKQKLIPLQEYIKRSQKGKR